MMDRIKYKKGGVENYGENKILRRGGIENDGENFFEKRRYKIMENIKSGKIRYWENWENEILRKRRYRKWREHIFFKRYRKWWRKENIKKNEV